MDGALTGQDGPVRELRVGSLPDSFNRNPRRPDLGKFPLNTSLFDTLARMNGRFEVEPMLAAGWEYDAGTTPTGSTCSRACGAMTAPSCRRRT